MSTNRELLSAVRAAIKEARKGGAFLHSVITESFVVPFGLGLAEIKVDRTRWMQPTMPLQVGQVDRVGKWIGCFMIVASVIDETTVLARVNRSEFNSPGGTIVPAGGKVVLGIPYTPQFECFEAGEDMEVTRVDQYGLRGFVAAEGTPFCRRIEQQAILVNGPEQEGDPEENNFVFPWLFWRDRRALEFGEYLYARVDDPNPTSASEYLPPDLNSSWLGFAFDSVGSPVFAVQSDDARFFIRRKQAGDVVTFGLFDGVTPLLWSNGEALDYILDAGNRDVVCFYAKRTPNDNALYARFQRDNFGIEYTLIDDVGFSLRDLTTLRFTEQGRLEIYATTADGKGMLIQSALYDLSRLASEEMAFRGGFMMGAYTLTVIEAPPVDEEMSFRGGFGSIIYTDGVISLPTYDEELGFSGAFQAGTHTLVVVAAPTQDEEMAFAGAFKSGTYTLVVVSAGTQDEEMAFAGTFVSGLYDGPVLITSPSPLPNSEKDEPYEYTLVGTGEAPLSWSIISGSLPDGLSLSTAGVISGTPTEGGNFNFTVELEDDTEATDTKAFELSVVQDPVEYVGASPTTYGSGTSITSITIEVPGDAEEGDLLVACVMRRSNTSAPAGWTRVLQTPETPDFSQRSEVWVRSHNGTSTDYTFTQTSSGRMAGVMMAFRNASVTPIDSASTNTSVDDGGSLTTVSSVDARIGGVAIGVSSTVFHATAEVSQFYRIETSGWTRVTPEFGGVGNVVDANRLCAGFILTQATASGNVQFLHAQASANIPNGLTSGMITF